MMHASTDRQVENVFAWAGCMALQVPLLLGRARFCLSAAHTREMLEHALEQIEEVAELTMVKYDQH